MLFILNVLPAHAASVISLQAELNKSTAVPGSAITISGKIFKEGAPTKAVSPTMTVTDPQGNYIYSYQWNAPQDIGDDGSFTTVYNLVENAITGNYSVVLRAGDSLATLSFTVVPSGQILVTTNKNLYYENETVSISGLVNWNGAAVGNTDVTVKITDGNQVIKSIDQVKTAANGTYNSMYFLPTSVEVGVYTVEVAAMGIKNTTTFNVSPEPPNAITNFTGTATTTSVTLTWDASERAAGYIVKRDGVNVYEGSALTFTDNGLTPDTNYSYELVASNAGGETTPSTITVKTIKVAPTAPTNLTSTTATTTSISLTWDAAERAESYELRRNGEVIYTGEVTSFADSGLTPGTTYSYELKAINSGGASTTVTLSATTLPQPPNAITNFTGTATTTSVTLTWDASERAAGYIVKRDGVNVYEGSALTFTENGLTPDTNYSYELVASNAGGETTPSTITVKTIKVAPTAPTNLASTSATTTSISLTWDAAERAESYELRRNGEVIYTGEATSFADSGLTPGTTYSYELKAVNSGGVSSIVTLSATTVKLPPIAPTGFTYTATTTSINLTWSAVAGAESYELKRNGTVVYSGTAVSFVDTGLTSGTNYSYELKAVNSGGASQLATLTATTQQVVVTPPPPPPPPAIVVPGSVTGLKGEATTNSVSITWNAVSGAEKYELKRNGTVVYTGATTSFIDTGLTAGTAYSYEIKAINAGGSSSAATISVSTLQAVPGAITNFKGVATANSINLTWDTSAQATSYTLKRNGQTVYEGTGLSFMDSGLVSNTTYNYELVAKNTGGGTTPVTITVSTLKGLPKAPTNLQFEAEATSISFSWDEVAGAEEYVLIRSGEEVYRGTETNFNDTSLLPGRKYNYRLLAVNTVGESSPVRVAVDTLSVIPSAVTGLKAKSTENQVNLTWNAAEFASSYIVKLNGKVLYSGTKTEYTHRNLKSNTTYTYSVTAINKAGVSKGNSISIKTKAIQTKTSVSVSKPIYKQSESVIFTIKVTDENNKVIPLADVTSVVKDANGKTTTYKGKTNKSGVLVLTIKTSKSTKVGTYKVSFTSIFNVKSAYSNSNATGSYTIKK
jgi:chitodextrinase